MIKHQEEGRKIRLVSHDQVQAPELDLIQPQVPGTRWVKLDQDNKSILDILDSSIYRKL